MSFYTSYRNAVAFTFPTLEPDFLLVGAILASALAITYVGLFFDMMLGGLMAVLVFDLAVGYPLYKRNKRISEVERLIPDVFSHMGTSLRAGATVESALQEVARGKYGPISEDLKTMIRELREGKTFEEAFSEFGERTESKNVQRSVNVIISAKRTGGGLVAALSSIANDMRENYRLTKERQAKTMVQVLFIVIAANIVSPFIFGLVSGIILFLGNIGGSDAPPLFNTLIFYFKGYLVLSAVFSSLAAAMIKEGNVSKAVIYGPILLVVTYGIFMVVSYFAKIFFVA